MIYLIVLKENNIKVSVYDTLIKSFEILKNKGEQWQKYDDNFWNWFKKKTSYQDEILSFVLLTDTKDLGIPQDINISKINKIQNNTTAYALISKEQIVCEHIIFIPELTTKLDTTTKVEESNDTVIKKGSLNEYYKHKSNIYKNN